MDAETIPKLFGVILFSYITLRYLVIPWVKNAFEEDY